MAFADVSSSATKAVMAVIWLKGEEMVLEYILEKSIKTFDTIISVMQKWLRIYIQFLSSLKRGKCLRWIFLFKKKKKRCSYGIIEILIIHPSNTEAIGIF